MISGEVVVGGYNISHKDGYYLLSEMKLTEEGKEYKTQYKTFANKDSLESWCVKNNVSAEVGEILNAADLSREDYLRKEGQQFIKTKLNRLKKVGNS